jgi:hypothetical protein
VDELERAHQLRELTLHPGWPVLVEMAEQRIHALQRELIAGKAADYAEYRSKASMAAGMQDVFALPERALRMAEAKE